MTKDDVDKLVKAIEERGGSITLHDPRVSQVQTWLIGLVGTGGIVALGWMASSLDSLSKAVTKTSVQIEYMEHRIQRLEDKK